MYGRYRGYQRGLGNRERSSANAEGCVNGDRDDLGGSCVLGDRQPVYDEPLRGCYICRSKSQPITSRGGHGVGVHVVGTGVYNLVDNAVGCEVHANVGLVDLSSTEMPKYRRIYTGQVSSFDLPYDRVAPDRTTYDKALHQIVPPFRLRMA